MIYNKDKDEQLFLNRVVKISPEEFVGLVKLLGVRMSNVNKETGEFSLRDAEEVLCDCINIFRKLPHKARKVILKAMLHTRGKEDGTTSEYIETN